MNLAKLQSDPAAFRSALLIDTDAGPRPLGDCMDDWQRKDFEALDSGWQRAVLGTKHKAKYQRGWLERPRGHSKSLDLGIMAAWALFASRRRLSGIAAAGDLDQARLLRDAIGKLVYVNPWLSSILEVQNYRVINTRTESTLEIISSDAKTSYGLTPDFVVADEVVHWKNRDLFDSLISSAAKRSTCMFVVITNAGLSDDWVWKTREVVRNDPTWYFSRLDGPMASWITPDRLAEQERLLPNIAYRRLWLNEWTSGGGDALTEEDINYAFSTGLQRQSLPQSGYQYVAGLDLGVSRDASALCVLGIVRGADGHGRIRLADMQIWLPRKGQKVQLSDIELALIDSHKKFNLKQINYDSWQATHLAQRLQSSGLGRIGNKKASLPMMEVPPTGQNLQRQATVVLESFNDRRVELFHDADLKRDLHRLRVEERSYGFRLTSPRDEHGHGDAASAFCLAMLAASDLAGKRRITAGVFTTSSSGKCLTPFERDMAKIDRENTRREKERVELDLIDGTRFDTAQALYDNFGESWRRGRFDRRAIERPS